MTGLVLLHGWGFGPFVWQPWAEAFPERPVLLLDAGYFGPWNLTVPENADGWIGVGHSQGFAHLLTRPVPWRGLVGFGAFLRFCRLPGKETGTPQEVIDAMVAKMSVDPAEVLRRFTRRCGQETSCTAPLTQEGLDCLRQDLAWLRELDLVPPHPVPPCLLLHAKDDRIAPLALAQEALERLPGARLEVFNTGSHALPFTRTQQCLEFVQAFIKECDHGGC